jgi:hypothetical protein
MKVTYAFFFWWGECEEEGKTSEFLCFGRLENPKEQKSQLTPTRSAAAARRAGAKAPGSDSACVMT